jgi:imidazolonepropionase-like amidohydrolase
VIRSPWPVLLVLLVALLAAGARADADLAIVGGTIHPAPGVPPIEGGVVLVRDGKIEAVGPRSEVAVPEGTEVIAADGGAVTAGLWNCHVHFTAGRLFAAGWLPGWLVAEKIRDLLTRYGFVHALDTGSWLASTARLRGRLARHELPGPRLRVASGSFVAPGGSPFYLKPIRLPEIATPEEARARVAETLDGGADGIKLMTGGLASPEDVVVMDTDVVRAAVETAHARGAFVVAHPTNSAGARAALEGGVDILAHTFPGGHPRPWDRSLLPRMKAAGMALVPTLMLWPYELRRAGLPDETVAAFLAAAQEQVRAYAALGGELLFGTDVGYMEDHDPSDEYAYLEAAGLSFAEILGMLTTAPARRFGAAARTGRVEPGLDADLVVLDADPARDVRALARVRAALRGGEVVFRAP